MASQSRSLVFSTTPYDDESFMGYLIRLTELNHYETPSWILQLAQVTNYLRKVGRVFDDSLDLAPLQQLTGVDKSRLQPLVYIAPTKRTKFGDYFVFGSPVPRLGIQIRPPKICPGCLSEFGYIRRIWDLTAVTTCPLHKCLLLDRCPNCLKQLSLIRRRVTVCRCDYDWRRTPLINSTEAELEVTTRVHSLCNLFGGREPSQQQVSANPLDALELKDLLSALFSVASQYAHISKPESHKPITKFGVSMRNADLNSLLCKAAPVFHDWPSNYFSFLEWTRKNARPTKYLRGLRSEFARYQRVLYVQLTSPALDFIREGFEQYIATVWDGGYTSNIKRLRATMLHNKKFASRTEAAKLLESGCSKVDELLEQGKLRSIIRSRGQNKIILVERDSILELKSQQRDLFNPQQAAKRLGITTGQLKGLKSYGLLRTNELYHSRGKIGYSSTEIDAFLDSLRRRVSHARTLASKAIVNFDYTRSMLTQRGVGLGEFLASILVEQIRPIQITKAVGLKALSFCKDDVVTFSKALYRKRITEAVRIADAATMLKTDKNTVMFLLRQRLLNANKEFVASRPLIMIPKMAIAEFEANYVLTTTLATELNTTGGYVLGILEMEGIWPVSGKKVDGGPRYIFRRRDLREIDLGALVRAKKQAAKIAKTRARIFNIAQAAELLATDENSILTLVGNEVLTPRGFTHRRPLNKKRCSFRESSLQKCKAGRIAKYVDLISIRAAARLFRKGVGFSIKYAHQVPLKKTHFSSDPKGYYRIKDVQELIKREKSFLRAQTVAGILSISQTQLLRLTASQILKPVFGPRIDGSPINLYLSDDVEALRRSRESFRNQRVQQNRSSRFGSPAGNQRSPVLETISNRVEELLSEARECGIRLTGGRLHRQLLDEGYKVGINSAYVCLRTRRASKPGVRSER